MMSRDGIALGRVARDYGVLEPVIIGECLPRAIVADVSIRTGDGEVVQQYQHQSVTQQGPGIQRIPLIQKTWEVTDRFINFEISVIDYESGQVIGVRSWFGELLCLP